MEDHETSSALPRIAKCPPSAALPGSRSSSAAATMGSAKHDHMHDRARLGVDEAIERLPLVAATWQLPERETRIFIAQMRKFEWSPPAQSFGEVAFALLTDGTVERTVGGRGRYPELEVGGRLHGKAFLAGQNDIMWAEPTPLDLTDPQHPRCPPESTLWSGDYKSGDDANVERVEDNAQILANTVMAAKWTGATRAVPFILYLTPPEGDWDTPAVVWGPEELARAAVRLASILEARREQVDRARAGQPLTGFNEGPWCKFCPGASSCEAKIRLMRNVAELANVPSTALALSDEQYAFWAERISQAESYLQKVRAILKDRADEGGPIPLGNGLLWGAKPPKPTTSFSPRVAIPIVAEHLGSEDEAWKLVKISKDSIEKAIREKHMEQGIKRKLAPAMRDVFASVAREGGLIEETKIEYGAFRADRILPAPTEPGDADPPVDPDDGPSGPIEPGGT